MLFECINLLFLKWLDVVVFVCVKIYCKLINGMCLIFKFGCNDIGFLYLCWMYIFKWFLKFLFILGKWICGLMFFDFRNFELFILDNCSNCGVLNVLLDKMIFLVLMVCSLLFFLYVILVVFLFL